MFIKIKGRLYSLPNLKTISDEDLQNEMKNYLILKHIHKQNSVVLQVEKIIQTSEQSHQNHQL